MKKILKWTIVGTFLMAIVVGGFGLWILFGTKTSNPNNYKTIGEIPTPWGYERVEGHDRAYSEFLRLLPLKGKGSEVMLFTGGKSRFQSLNYAVVDLPLLSNAEQCADVCMRLRAEYLYTTGQYGKIHFRNVNGKTMRYSGGSSRRAFDNYLRGSLWHSQHLLIKQGITAESFERYATRRCVCLCCRRQTRQP